MVDLETIVRLAAHRGFIFPGSDIYGGLANSWDYGPLGVELKNNIKQAWWRKFVRNRADVVGIDAALMMNSKVWEASGHLETFNDPLVECKNCHARSRADQVDLQQACSICGEGPDFTEAADFNLMFKTFMGPKQEAAATVYLRPETAQAMFVDFLRVQQSMRMRVPFGIAQIGRAFRNEITPGNFIFRTREFEQMEIEYFVAEKDWEKYFDEWLKLMHDWIKYCGIDEKLVHEKEIADDDLAHYSKRTVDIEFDFPFGRSELYGIAYRTDFDLRKHAEASGKDLQVEDPVSGEKFYPHVVEPTFGTDRTVLAILLSAYHVEDVKGEKRVVMKFKPELAPYQVAVLPLSRKEELAKVAKPVVDDLRKDFSVDYDETQSIGKRYRRQDEIGTPFCVTVDFDSLEDKQVTVRERDSMKQERIEIDKVIEYLKEKIYE